MNKEQILNSIEQNYPISIDLIKEYFLVGNQDDFMRLNNWLNELESEYLIALNSKQQYIPFGLSDYKIGNIVITSKGYGFVDQPDQSYYVGASKLFGAMNGDLVLLETTKGEGIVRKIIKHQQSYLALKVKLDKGKVVFESGDTAVKGLIKVNNAKLFSLVDGLIVKAKIIQYYPTIEVEIVALIGHKNDPGVDISAILANYEITSEFPKVVLEQANLIDTEVKAVDKVGRVNHLSLRSITIDGDDAKDLDDAVSIEKTKDGYLVYVHIADVSHYVRETSAIDIEAANRGTSVYVVDRVVPMLPHSLSNGICSLNPRVERLTITCKMLINNVGEIVDYDIYPSFIQTVERMTYYCVNEILENKKKTKERYAHVVKMLEQLNECASKIRRLREKNGALDFNRAEAKIIVDSKGVVKAIELREQKAAEQLIEDLMISANVCVARQMHSLDIPSLYRVHGEPKEGKLQEVKKLASNLGCKLPNGKKAINPLTLQKILRDVKDSDSQSVLIMALLKCMSKAVYSPNCTGHFGLALPEYLHFTSPIRRYPDLLVHRYLRKYLFAQNYDAKMMAEDNSQLINLAGQSSYLERRAVAAENEVMDMKKAEFMIKYVGQVFSGIISFVTKFGFYVELANTVEGLVHVRTIHGYYEYDVKQFCLINRQSHRTYKLGQRVNCIVKKVNKDQRLIEFEVVEEKGGRHGKSYYRKSKSKS